MNRRFLAALVAGFAAAAAFAGEPLPTRTTADGHHLTDGPRGSAALTQAIRAQDAKLFAAVFDQCDPDAFAQLVTADVEFYHDKWGQTASSRDKMVADMRDNCAKRKTGENFTARRELVEESLQVYPMNDYGALEMGVHRFYKITPGKPDELTETGRFVQLWKEENGVWKLARIVSYDHRLGE